MPASARTVSNSGELPDGTVTREYRAREVFGEEKALWWRRAVQAYPEYAEYQRAIDRRIPLLVLEPGHQEHTVR